jgi:hypothetical protein
MVELSVSESRPASGGKSTVGRLFVLELNAGRIHSMNPDESDKKTIVTDCRNCDGIVADVEAGHIYWTNMGIPYLNDGSIERADINGKNRKFIVLSAAKSTGRNRVRAKETKVRATAGSSDEHVDTAPDLFTTETPLGTYQGTTERVLSRIPAAFKTVLVLRGSSKPEWLAH